VLSKSPLAKLLRKAGQSGELVAAGLFVDGGYSIVTTSSLKRDHVLMRVQTRAPKCRGSRLCSRRRRSRGTGDIAPFSSSTSKLTGREAAHSCGRTIATSRGGPRTLVEVAIAPAARAMASGSGHTARGADPDA